MARKLPVPLRTIVITQLIVLLAHLYVGLRLLPGFDAAPLQRYALWGLLLISYLMMPVSLMARSMRNPRTADRLAWLGFTVMGFFSSLFALTLLRDLILLGAWALRLAPLLDASGLALGARIVMALAALATLWGYVNARRAPAVVRITVPMRDLPAGLDGYSLAQISDLHVGPTIKSAYVRKIVEQTNALAANAIVITGDVVDGRVHDLAEHTQPLGQLRAPGGVYLVTGNHEYYSGADAWVQEFKRLGLRVLMNEHVLLAHQGARLVLAGVTDYSAHHFDPQQRSDPAGALAGSPGELACKILLAHQPRTADAALQAGFGLQLSGHTHGGQFWPWNLFVPLQQPYVAGLHKHGALWVYTSRGTGYWGPPKRLGAPAEITLITLRCAAPA